MTSLAINVEDNTPKTMLLLERTADEPVSLRLERSDGVAIGLSADVPPVSLKLEQTATPVALALSCDDGSSPDLALSLSPQTDVSLGLQASSEQSALALSLLRDEGLTLGLGPALTSPGQLENVYGWILYNDPDFSVNLIGGQRTLLDLSNLSAGISNLLPQYQSHDFFQGGEFRPIGTTAGGKYRLRLNVDVRSAVVSNTVRFELDIGGTQGVIDTANERLQEQAGDTERITPPLDFFTAGTFIANGGEVYATARTNCTLEILSVLVILEMVS